jgi:hypothetical protein
MTLLFISHSSRDLDFVENELAPTVETLGMHPWYSKRAIRGSEAFEREIRNALENSDRFLLAMSPEAASSEWVRAEVHWALEIRKIPVVPVMFRTCKPGDIHVKLPLFQLVDYRNATEQSRARLGEALGVLEPSWRKASRKAVSAEPSIASIELWISDQTTELRVHHDTDNKRDGLEGLEDQYSARFEEKASLSDAIRPVFQGFFGHVPRFEWNRRFRAGPLDSAILGYMIHPSAFNKAIPEGCTLTVYPAGVEIDLWDDGDSIDYLASPLDDIGIDFASVGEGARRLASVMGLREATKACWPILQSDDVRRGFPYLFMELI